MDISIVMNIITFWAHTRFNSIFPLVKIISERLKKEDGLRGKRDGWMDGWVGGGFEGIPSGKGGGFKRFARGVNINLGK